MGALLQFQNQLFTETCCSCYMTFAMPYDLYKKKLDNHTPFFCPAGHSQSYTGKSEAEKLREQLESEKKNSEWLRSQRDSANKRADKESHVARAYKGVITKNKNRVGHGVCPCCNRTFKQLQAHMKTQHPDYAKKDV